MRARPSLLLCAALLAGCAHYTPMPLPSQPNLAASVPQLIGAPAKPRLSVADVATLAVENSPDLRAVRAQRGVATAQVLQAGIPPNPSVTGAILPLAAGLGSTSAWNAGLSMDITALVTLSRRREAAVASAQQVNAQILWQEWQTIGQARLLAVDVIEGGQLLSVLQRERQLLDGRVTRSRRAVAVGDATLTTLAPDIAALQSARVAEQDQSRIVLAKRHQLAALLGLQAEAPFALEDTLDVPPLDLAVARREVATLPNRRPDLIALQLGYAASNAKLRAAILAQFPRITFGVTGGSDNSNVRNVGPQIGIELPVFDRNQGNIAIETATRQQLLDEYDARLAAAAGQIGATAAEIEQLRAQLANAEREQGDTTRMAREAQSALASGAIDERSYVDLVITDLAKQVQIVALRQALLEQEVGLETLIGAGMPPVRISPETTRS